MFLISSLYSIASYIPIRHLYHEPLQVGQTPPVVLLPDPVRVFHSLVNASRMIGVIDLELSSLISAARSIDKKHSTASCRSCVSLMHDSFAHVLQTLLPRRCAITRLNVPATIYGNAHKLKTRVIVSADELVWIVEKTKCQVIAASIAMISVSLSRISHTMIISGS